MKAKKQKRMEAVERMKGYRYEDSKAFRTKSLSKEEWTQRNQEAIEELS